MLARSRGLRAFVATLGLLVSMSLGQLMFTDAAHASCNGNGSGNEVVNSLIVNGVVYASETPVSGTCNLNNAYRADFRSHRAGWRASVWIQNNGLWSGHYGVYGTGDVSMTYGDNNSYSLIHLCADDGSTWYCGWGNISTNLNAVTHTYYGYNTGF